LRRAPRMRAVGTPKDPGKAFHFHGQYGGPGWTGGEWDGGNFAVEPIDALDACFRTHDFFYHLGKQKTGDLQLVADLAAHDTDIARVCSRVFQWKAAHHSVDRDGDISFIVGAEDLYQRFAVQPPMHYRPHQPPVVLPLPQTLRDLVVSFLSVFL